MAARILKPLWLASLATSALGSPLDSSFQESDTKLQKRFDATSLLEKFAGSSGGNGITSILPNGLLENLPMAETVMGTLDLTPEQMAHKPVLTLNLPGYANWTGAGWNYRARGYTYKQPDTPPARLNELANAFIMDIDVEQMEMPEQNQARNVTASIFIVQQRGQEVHLNFETDAYVPPEASNRIIRAVSLPNDAGPSSRSLTNLFIDRRCTESRATPQDNHAGRL
jgi:hypothetical protein